VTAVPAPALKWPGAKWNLAEWICGHLPPHRVYLEPYFGSGAVFFTKEPARLETINDLDGDVVNLFRIIRDRPEDLARAAALTPWARAEHLNAWEQQRTGEPVEDARRFLVRIWMNHGMRVRRRGGWAHATGLKTTTGGISPRVPAWLKVPERILATAGRLREAQIEQLPAVEVIGKYAHADCLTYCDPPYVLRTRSEAQYRHEMTDGDHGKLLAALEAHPGPVLLSGYADPLYDSALPHWRRIERTAFAEGGRERTEVLWLNPVAARRLERAHDQARHLEVPA
jgi:DNA adenine methylase